MAAKTMQEWKEQSKGTPPELAKAAWKYAQRLGGGDRAASLPYYQLLLETAMQESKLGTMKKNNAQENFMQIDEGTVKDFRNRYSKELGEWLTDAATPAEAHVGLAAFIYNNRMKKEDDLSTVEGRAKVWKERYNTSSGKGTPEKYIENNKVWKWGD